MAKDFNEDLDQTDGEQRRKVGESQGRDTEKKPISDPKAARERAGEGFENPADEYAETGSRGAGYREEGGKSEPKKRP